MFIFFTQVIADDVSGHITESTEWVGNINVVGDITIDEGATLYISEGTYIEFQGYYQFNVKGTLLAIGTEVNPITFTALNQSTGWHGIHFDQTLAANDSSKIIYCKLQFGKAYGDFPDGCGGVIFVNNFSKLLIANCSISNNSSEKGGGVYCKDSNITLIKNIINYNNYTSSGGGIYCYGGNPVIIENIISHNNTNYQFSRGGGIYYAYSDAMIIRNKISDNLAFLDGGGISSYYSNSTLENNIIIRNSANDGDGGGIYCNVSSDIIKYNLINTNNAEGGIGGGIACVCPSGAAILSPALSNNIISDNIGYNGGGIHCYNCSPMLFNNTIANNIANQLGGGIDCNEYAKPILTNNIIWGNSSLSEGNQVSISNSKPDFYYCDIQGGLESFGGGSSPENYENNIDVDPNFVDSDYHLGDNSLCIDGGNPAPEYYDPEDSENPGNALYPAMGTIINDIGAYGGPGVIYFNLFTENNFILIPSQSFLFQNYPNPFNSTTTIKFNLPYDTHVNISIYNITGQLVKTVLNENKGAGNHSLIWNGKNEKNESVGSGVYIYILTTEKRLLESKKMVLLK